MNKSAKSVASSEVVKFFEAIFSVVVEGSLAVVEEEIVDEGSSVTLVIKVSDLYVV